MTHFPLDPALNFPIALVITSTPTGPRQHRRKATTRAEQLLAGRSDALRKLDARHAAAHPRLLATSAPGDIAAAARARRRDPVLDPPLP